MNLVALLCYLGLGFAVVTWFKDEQQAEGRRDGAL